MLTRTRVLGEELVVGLERMDDVLEAHETNKQGKWLSQGWEEHLARAIAHLSNALVNRKDGSEIEAAHGAVRALMGLVKIMQRGEPLKSCLTHAIQKIVAPPEVEILLPKKRWMETFNSTAVDHQHENPTRKETLP